jgi:hypothetical protein
VDERVNGIFRKVALVIDQTLVLGTPVDTGRARSNWLVQINHEATTPVEPYVPGEKRSTEAANTQAALNHASRVVAERKRGQKIYISNNVDYIGKLNAGSSRQAPAGFVQKAFREAIQALRNARVFDD